tara:strand:+ start:1470 stop:1916 length:447 start_codon:yes stop_codon:yes gene_type:complete
MDKIIVFFSFFILFVSNSYAKTEYYLTLRNEKVNLRQGPSLDHPVKLVYKKKFLPVLVIDRSYNFRKIIDHENNSGWIHVSQLSKKKAALNNQESSIIFQKPSKYSKPLAVVEKGRLFLVKKCKNGWCKIKTENYSGWIMKQNLKGRL